MLCFPLILFLAPAISRAFSFARIHARLPGRTVMSMVHREPSYEDYLEQVNLRSALRKCPTFESLEDPLDLESLVQWTATNPTKVLSKGESIFEMGDPGDAMYIVKSGQVSILSTDNKVVQVCEPGDSFGELALLFHAPRGAKAVASADDTKLWKVDESTFHKVVRGKSEQAAAAGIVRDERYADYVERAELRSMVKQCPIFKGFSADDLERCIRTMSKVSCHDDATILKQGDETEDAMYFVASGTLDCIDEKKKPSRVVNVLGKGDYFGELALLFHGPRAVTVKVASNSTEPCSLWKLSREDFNAAVQEHPPRATALEAMKTKYQEKSLWRTLLKMNRQEIYDLMVAASRPKKKSVSFHSTLASVVTGMFLLIHLAHLKPRWADEYGRLQIFRITELTPLANRCYRIVSVLYTCVAFLGLLRLSKNAPVIRRLTFEYMAWASLATWTVVDSNIFGHALGSAGFTFDAWSWFGRLAMVGTSLKAILVAVRFLDHSIRGSMRGRETLPLGFNRFAQFLVASLLYWVLFLILLPSKFMFLDQDYVIATGCPPVINTAPSTCCTTIANQGFAALIATLQYESKISLLQGTILVILCAFIQLWDGFKFASRRIFEQAGGTTLSSPFPYTGMFRVLYVGTLGYGPIRRLIDKALSISRKKME